MILQTKRLIIYSLNLELLKKLINGESIQKELSLNNEPLLDADTNKAMQGLYEKALLNKDKYFWLTNWQIILTEQKKSIGSACFMDIPDENGQVEIGYGIDEQFRNKGYMTEAVLGLCVWAFKNKAKIISAETEKDNLASQKVLEKVGFLKSDERDGSCFYKLYRNIRGI